MQYPKRYQKSNDLPPELQQEILNNGAAMRMPSRNHLKEGNPHE